MIEPQILFSDPVFQLNTLLWAVLGYPTNPSINPVLKQAGYYLYAIERRLVMPKNPSIVSGLAELIGSKDSVHQPIHSDIWLKHKTNDVDIIIELKAHGFSTESVRPTRQALKMLTAASDLSPSLGEHHSRSGCVTYCTSGDDADELAATFERLQLALKGARVPAAPVGVVGFVMKPKGMALTSPDSSQLPDPLRQALDDQPIVLTKEDENDLLPLYFIPWIPGVEDSQHSELQRYGYSELSARLLVRIIREVGTVEVPDTLAISAGELLNAATGGTFKYWRHNNRNLFISKAANVGYRILKSLENVKLEQGGRVLTVDLPTSDIKKCVLDRLEKETPDDFTRNLQSDMGGAQQLPLNGDFKRIQL